MVVTPAMMPKKKPRVEKIGFDKLDDKVKTVAVAEGRTWMIDVGSFARSEEYAVFTYTNRSLGTKTGVTVPLDEIIRLEYQQ